MQGKISRNEEKYGGKLSIPKALVTKTNPSRTAVVLAYKFYLAMINFWENCVTLLAVC